ncbi:hypothetical protein QOT17_021952 [Balamuthia mandrillaris]
MEYLVKWKVLLVAILQVVSSLVLSWVVNHPSPGQRVARFFGYNRKYPISTFQPVIFMEQFQMVEMNDLAIIGVDVALDMVVKVRQNLNNFVWATPTVY